MLKCNAKSSEWDQRTSMRQEELTAITTAIQIITSKIKEKKSFLQTSQTSSLRAMSGRAQVSETTLRSTGQAPAHLEHPRSMLLKLAMLATVSCLPNRGS